jgi:hypothetical protein
MDLTGIKWDTFENLSTTTIIESCCFTVMGKPIIKSIEIVSHFYSRIAKGCNNSTK